jgi:hypothetical protein
MEMEEEREEGKGMHVRECVHRAVCEFACVKTNKNK